MSIDNQKAESAAVALVKILADSYPFGVPVERLTKEMSAAADVPEGEAIKIIYRLFHGDRCDKGLSDFGGALLNSYPLCSIIINIIRASK